MITDTHIHLYAEEYDSDRKPLINQALAAGVDRFLLPNIDGNSLDGMMSLVHDYPGVCFPMIGLHPCYIKADYLQQLQLIRSALEKHSKDVIAIGEIGLDFYWDLTFKTEQEKAFREQVQWAIEMNLPIAIHSRNSTNELIEILKDINSTSLTGVFHCFSGTQEQATVILDMGFYLGIGGVATFKNSGLDKIIPEIPLDRILLETDGPYLAPVPFRGKRNEPAYLKMIAEKVAAIKGITLEELAIATSENATNLFKI
jgi:TatD DNase family protein